MIKRGVKKPTEAPTPAISYSRFSTPAQEEGRSYDRQISRAEKFCKENNMVLLPTRYHDAGISAWEGKNKQASLGVLLEGLRSEDIETPVVVVVESIDRFSRQAPIDAIDVVKDILKTGAEIVTLEDGIRYSSESVRKQSWQLQILISHFQRAHNESNLKSERVGDAWQDLKEQAKKDKTVITKRVPYWLEVKDGKIVPIAAREKVVEQIFIWRAEGFGAHRIIKKLREEYGEEFINNGWGGGKWQTSYVQKILHNRACLGDYVQHERRNGVRKPVLDEDKQPVIVEGYYHPVITYEQWNAAQLGLARGKIAGSSGKHTGRSENNLFAGLTYSANSGRQMFYENKDSKHSWQYLTDRRGTSVNYWAFLVRFMSAMSGINWNAIMEEESAKGKAASKEVESLNKDLERLNTKVKNTVALLDDEDSSLGELREKLKTLKAERRKIEEKLKELRKIKIEVEFEAETAEEWMQAANERGRLAKLFIRRALSRIVITSIDRFDFEFRSGRVQKVQWRKDKDGKMTRF